MSAPNPLRLDRSWVSVNVCPSPPLFRGSSNQTMQVAPNLTGVSGVAGDASPIVACNGNGFGVTSTLALVTRESVEADKQHQTSAPKQRRWGIPLRAFLVVSLCVFTAFPAILLWLLSSQTSSQSISDLKMTSKSSAEDLAAHLRDYMIQNAEISFLQFVQYAEKEFEGILLRLYKGSGAPTWTPPDTPTSYFNRLYTLDDFFVPIRINEYNSMTTFMIWMDVPTSYPRSVVRSNAHGVAFVRFMVPRDDGLPATEDIYHATLFWNDALNQSTTTYYLLDPNNGSVLVKLFEFQGPGFEHVNYFTGDDATKPAMMGWENDIEFNPSTGFSEMRLYSYAPIPNIRGAVGLNCLTNVWIVSSFLRKILNGPKERLYLNFRTPAGTLIGASHGKFFSHSDIDYSKVNPINHPPPVSEFRKFSPVNSTDAHIAGSAVKLLELYGGWDMVPKLNMVLTILNEEYWAASTIITTSVV